ncbi:MAG: CarD family transcriptional regulator [Clostridia bacterium]|nr:CarD family transcriptional regulator [Clostridia bacterium]
MYRVGDKIAHPMHGAGEIVEIIEKIIDGEPRTYYLMKMTTGSMTVMIPCDQCESVGVRDIISADEADALLRALPALEVESTQNWNKRYRENMLKIKSGDLYQVAEVVKSLYMRDLQRCLSTGERKIFSSAKQILISEIMLAKHASYEEIEHMVGEGLIDSNDK